MAQDVVPDQRSDESSNVLAQDGYISSNVVEHPLHSNNGSDNDNGNGRSMSNGNSSSAIAPNLSNRQTSDFAYSPAPSQPMTQKNSSFLSGKWGVLVGLGVGLVIGAGVLPRFTGADASQSEATPAASADAIADTKPGQAVTVAPVESTRIVRTLDATGTVVASDLLPILAKAPGLQIQQVLVDEGSSVTIGQPLAILDQSVIRTQIAGAEADLQAAKARVIQREAALAQSKAQLAEAQANLERYQDLAERGAVSEQELDARSTTAATAREDVRVAEANISSAQADVLSEEARVQQLKTQLGQSVVTAPANGVIAERFARVGDVTSSSQSLFTVIRDRLLELEVSIPETQLPSIQIGNSVTIRSDADPTILLQGQVQEIDPLIDAQTRQAVVNISLPASDKLRPGMFLQAALTTDTVQGVTIPASAVLPQPSGNAIAYRISSDDSNNQVQAQIVEIGELLDDGTNSFTGDSSSARIEILQGLNMGDRVVVEGASYLKDGDRVEIIDD
ncbi:MAG: efflux RND transporter periplasmic adaptor subunit [Cyanobacteria bacterium P01_F01_bin.150]